MLFTSRRVNSLNGLNKLLQQIEKGQQDKPFWLEIGRGLVLADLPAAELASLMKRLHGGLVAGFELAKEPQRKGQKRLAFWQILTRNGFHNFCDYGWLKCENSPEVFNYDYLHAYQQGGLAEIDPYALYSAVLGTYNFTLRDFIGTWLCEDVATIVEPMAGSAEFSWCSHFQYPDKQYLMLDLDEQAKQHVEQQYWWPQTDKQYFINDVLSEQAWQKVKQNSKGVSLSYLGKQSHHFFNAKQLFELMRLGCNAVDYFILETPNVGMVSNIAETDDLTRPEMRDVGLSAGLVMNPDGAVNPLTNALSFRLDVWDDSGSRTLFDFADWYHWQHPTLVAFAQLLGLHCYYFHSEFGEFFPVTSGVDSSDCMENSVFMLFTRHAPEAQD